MKYKDLYKLDNMTESLFRALWGLRNIGGENTEDIRIDEGSDINEYLDGEECVKNLNYLCSAICAKYNRSETPYIDFFDDKLDDIETAMLSLDDKGRSVVLSRAIRFAPICSYDKVVENDYENKAFEILKKIQPNADYSEFSCMLDALGEYISGLKMLAIDFGLVDTITVGDEIKSALLSMPDRYFVFDDYYAENKNERSNKRRYRDIPRTHRIAAVWGLIDKLGLRRSNDKTTLAAFVEAVTGGNIDAQPQDTVSYKKLESSAQEAAAKWLKKIGIE